MVKSVWLVMVMIPGGEFQVDSVHATEQGAEKELQKLNDDGRPGHTLGPYVVRE